MKDSSEAFDLSELEMNAAEPASETSDAAKGAGKLVRSIQLKISAEDLGRANGLRHTILTLVVEEEYSQAISRLKEFQDSKHEYPQFKARAGRYMSYAADLINGIKAKRSFPGVQTLAMSKQRELYDRATEHFNDLTATLRKVERIDREVRAEDSRSTVWVLKAMTYGCLAIFVVAFARELSRGLLPSVGLVADDLLDNITNRLFDSLGL